MTTMEEQRNKYNGGKPLLFKMDRWVEPPQMVTTSTYTPTGIVMGTTSLDDDDTTVTHDWGGESYVQRRQPWWKYFINRLVGRR